MTRNVLELRRGKCGEEVLDGFVYRDVESASMRQTNDQVSLLLALWLDSRLRSLRDGGRSGQLGAGISRRVRPPFWAHTVGVKPLTIRPLTDVAQACGRPRHPPCAAASTCMPGPRGRRHRRDLWQRVAEHPQLVCD